VHKQYLEIVVVLESSTMTVRFGCLIARNVAILSTIELNYRRNREGYETLRMQKS
jgi:hypothetical protein